MIKISVLIISLDSVEMIKVQASGTQVHDQKQLGWNAYGNSWLIVAEVIGNIYENPDLLEKFFIVTSCCLKIFP